MDQIKTFLNEFFKLEAEATYLKNFRERLEEYNAIANEIKPYFAEFMAPFLHVESTLPYSDDFYNESKYAEETIPRHLFKITEYQNSNYDTIWCCYCSHADPEIGKSKLLSCCLIVAMTTGNFELVAEFNKDYHTKKWSFISGDRNLSFFELGDFTQVERIQAPVNDEWGLEEYLKDS